VKKRGIILSILALTLFVLETTCAALTLDVGLNLNLFFDNRTTGQGGRFGIFYDLGDDLSLGYVKEIGTISLKSDGPTAGTASGSVDLDTLMIMFTVMKNLFKVAGLNTSVGLGLGTASIVNEPVPSIGFDVGASANTAAVKILGKLSYQPKETGKVLGIVSLTLGYRTIDIKDVTEPFGTGSETLKDFNGLMFGLGMGLKF